MPTTFAVDSVKPSGKTLAIEKNTNSIWCTLAKTTPTKIQTCQNNNLLLAPQQHSDMTHQFIRAIHFAYDNHLPLSLSPDHVWTLLTQQLAFHVHANAESLRKQFVQFENKKTLVLEIGANPNWATVVDGFSALIAPHIGEQTHANLVANFSTTQATERICSEIVLMDTLSNYFEYMCMSSCGIPTVTLEGTAEDWEQLRQRAAGFAKYDLQHWLQHLLPILDEFVLAAHAKPNTAFWQSMYKVSGGSGGPYLSGWITDMFAYLDKNAPNKYLGHYKNSIGKKMFGTPYHPNSFAGTINQCPVKWNKFGTMIDLFFCAGFVGVSQDTKTKAIRPELGWAVILK